MPTVATSSTAGARHSHGSTPSKGTTSSSSPTSTYVKASTRNIHALRAATFASNRLKATLEESTHRLYALESEYLPLAASMAQLRARAAYVDQRRANQANKGALPTASSTTTTIINNIATTSAVVRPRNYIENPLLPSEINEYLVNSGGGGGSKAEGASAAGANSANGSSTAAATVTSPTGTGATSSRTYHGWSVVGVESVTTSSANSIYKNNLVADPCRWVSLSYGPSMGMMDDLRSRQLLLSREGIAADVKLAERLERLKRGILGEEEATMSTSIDAETRFVHPMLYLRSDVHQ